MDSKDMDDAHWRRLLARCAFWLSQDDVKGLVITHGTDTLEETAYFLQAVLRPHKTVVLTCAMRAANAPDSDGPANLKDALCVVQLAKAAGVLLVCAGEIHAGHEIQKMHAQRLNPFTSGEQSPLGLIHNERLEWLREASICQHLGPAPELHDVLSCPSWPRVELVLNHASANGAMVLALLAADPPAGWVVAGTGNGTVHHQLQRALEQAQAMGAKVVRASRCAWGGVETRASDVFPHAGLLTAVQARVALMLALMAEKKAA
jgi:L-asparaginase